MRNYTIPICVFLVTALSLFTLYSASYTKGPFGESSVFLRQSLWIFLGWAAYLYFSRLSYRKLSGFIYPFYGSVILSLLLVLIIGGVRFGAQRWIKIWWFNFQPSEFAKLAIILILSRYFSRMGLDEIRLNVGNLSFLKGIFVPFLIIAMPFALIVKQPDMGTALLLIFIFLAMAYLAGVKLRYIISVLALGIAFSPFFWHFLKDYQKDRLLVFLNPNSDPLGAGYTIIQSQIAIGSGRFFGKGWLAGTQGQLNFLPEAHTDFIFGIFSEEAGLLGCALLIGIYFALIQSAFLASERTEDNFGRFFCFGMGLGLALQVYINISMTMGLSPVVGLPLPLMSYGGSSMLMTFIGLGIVQNIIKRG